MEPEQVINSRQGRYKFHAAERFAAPELGEGNKPTGTAKDRETGQTLQRDALHIVNIPEDMVVSSTPFVSSRRDRSKVGEEGRCTTTATQSPLLEALYTLHMRLVKNYPVPVEVWFVWLWREEDSSSVRRANSGNPAVLLALGRIRAAAGAISGIEA